MAEDYFFDRLVEKVNKLETETDKKRMRDLIIDIIVDLEKFCHRDNVQIHRVLADAREKCKIEIAKLYNK